MKSIPGNPFMQEQAIPEEIMKSLFNHYGLDKPIMIQYLKYLKGIVCFDLGPSFKYEGRSVNDVIKNGFPISFSLGIFALFLSLVWGILWGSISAIYRGKWQEKIATLFAVVGMSVPSFILATSLQYVLGIKLSILPIARWGSFEHMICPAIAMSAFPSAFIARLIKASMLEVLEKEYITLAKSKGLSSFQIWKKHIFKNSIIPLNSYLGTLTANILTGSFVVEKIFGIPGIGSWFVSSIQNRDYTLILGLTIFYSSILMLTIFISDLILFFLDPRIKNEFIDYERKTV
jgi:oligopeptide transport system permease protein